MAISTVARVCCTTVANFERLRRLELVVLVFGIDETSSPPVLFIRILLRPTLATGRAFPFQTTVASTSLDPSPPPPLRL